MAEDPFHRVADAPLFVVPRMLEALRAFRAWGHMVGTGCPPYDLHTLP